MEAVVAQLKYTGKWEKIARNIVRMACLLAE
jgi:hypothetical protein